MCLNGCHERWGAGKSSTLKVENKIIITDNKKTQQSSHCPSWTNHTNKRGLKTCAGLSAIQNKSGIAAKMPAVPFVQWQITYWSELSFKPFTTCSPFLLHCSVPQTISFCQDTATQGRRNILQTLECESLSGRVVAPSWELETRCYPGGVHRPNSDTLPVVSFHYAARPCTHSSNTWFCLIKKSPEDDVFMGTNWSFAHLQGTVHWRKSTIFWACCFEP